MKCFFLEDYIQPRKAPKKIFAKYAIFVCVVETKGCQSKS